MTEDTSQPSEREAGADATPEPIAKKRSLQQADVVRLTFFVTGLGRAAVADLTLEQIAQRFKETSAIDCPAGPVETVLAHHGWAYKGKRGGTDDLVTRAEFEALVSRFEVVEKAAQPLINADRESSSTDGRLPLGE